MNPGLIAAARLIVELKRGRIEAELFEKENLIIEAKKYVSQTTLNTLANAFALTLIQKGS